MPHPDYFVQSEIDRLRVNVGFSGTEKKIIMITSSEPNEGKSYVSVNLWNELVNAGKSVCFVDADMRKSDLRNTLRFTTDREEFAGLSHYLAGYVNAEEVIYSTDRKKAFFVPTATLVNPSLLLEGKRLNSLLQGLRQSFDYVIVDTPPLGVVSDGQMIATKCDGCILVIRAHATSKAAVRNSLVQLQQVECPLIGIVLNRVEDRRAKGYYAKGYYSKVYYTNNSGKKSGSAKSASRKKGGKAVGGPAAAGSAKGQETEKKVNDEK